MAIILPIGMILVLCALVIVGIPAAWALAGVATGAALVGVVGGFIDANILLAIPSRLIGSIVDSTYLMAIPLFVLMGVIISNTQVAPNMVRGVQALLGTQTTLLGLVVIGTLLAASTGIAAASVVILAMLAWPILRNTNNQQLGAGAICALGSLAQFLPPSLLLILLAEHINAAHLVVQNAQGNWTPDPITVGHLFAAALLPGLLLAGLYGAYIYWADKGVDQRTPHNNISHMPKAHAILWGFGAPLSLVLMVLGALLGGVATTTQAAAFGVAQSLCLAGLAGSKTRKGQCLSLVIMGSLIAFVGARFITKDVMVLSTLGAFVMLGLIIQLPMLKIEYWRLIGREAIAMIAMIFAIIMCASVFVLVMKSYGGDVAIRDAIQDLPGGAYGRLGFVLAIVFLLGCVLDSIEIIYILVPICAPILLAGDTISPIWLGICFALALQSGYLTPPVGLAIIFARSVIPKSFPNFAFYRAIWPFVGLQILLFVILLLIPQIVTYLPNLL